MTLSPARRRAFEQAGQGHAVRRLERLSGEARERLERDLEALDLGQLAELYALVGRPPALGQRFKPPELFPLRRGPAERARAAEARERGRELLADGKAAYVLVAGGQASRLGFDAPKGAFPLGPVTGRVLFDWHASRLAAARARHGARTPWYVMTSRANDQETRALFEENRWFGHDPEDLFFFVQDMLPALDEKGRILFAAPDEVFRAPDGHGGSLLALARSGALADMRSRGVEQISYFQVDNPLARPADPLFLGLHELARAGMSTKVVEKTDPAEKVGLIGKVDGRMGCIEYSDLPDELRHAREGGGQGPLRFRAGNIAVHALRVDFVESVAGGELQLPWHVAKKKMEAVDEDGQEKEVSGYKFETFVFDALAFSPQSVTLEVDRALEFAPVKNAEGTDSPATARAALCRLFASWLERAGGELPPPDEQGSRPVEVDPRFAEDEDEFLARLPARPHVLEGGHLYAP